MCDLRQCYVLGHIPLSRCTWQLLQTNDWRVQRTTAWIRRSAVAPDSCYKQMTDAYNERQRGFVEAQLHLTVVTNKWLTRTTNDSVDSSKRSCTWQLLQTNDWRVQRTTAWIRRSAIAPDSCYKQMTDAYNEQQRGFVEAQLHLTVVTNKWLTRRTNDSVDSSKRSCTWQLLQTNDWRVQRTTAMDSSKRSCTCQLLQTNYWRVQRTTAWIRRTVAPDSCYKQMTDAYNERQRGFVEASVAPDSWIYKQMTLALHLTVVTNKWLTRTTIRQRGFVEAQLGSKCSSPGFQYKTNVACLWLVRVGSGAAYPPI